MTEGSRGWILHVEDDPLVRQAITLLLGPEGYRVRSAASGPEALHLVQQERWTPDVLIVDFHLDADMNGAEFVEVLRRTIAHALPVIMLTGDPSSAAMPCITDAPVWMARKPLNPQLLLAAMPSLVNLSRSTRELTGAQFPR
jgi:CheY-like chemotaxis protein